jgi:hypothetical protein
VVWVALIGAMAFGVFQLKLAVQPVEEEFARLSRDLLASEETIHVLHAEWGYLNRPDRLAKLADSHLALRPMKPEQVGGIESLPIRSAVRKDAGDVQ